MKKMLGALALATTALVGTAHAADAPYMPMDKWFVHVGIAGVFYDPGFNGAPPVIPAGVAAPIAVAVTGIKLDNNVTGVIEAGRYLDDANHLALAVAAGIPPTTNVALNVGAGTFPVGKVTFGSLMLMAQYHMNPGGTINPYVGAGVAYNPVFSTTPTAPNAVFTVDSGVGFVLQAGAEAMLSEKVGIFADVKKMFTSTNSTTSLGTNNIHFDPLIVSAGVAVHF